MPKRNNLQQATATKSDFEILKEYILQCPNVGKDSPAMKAALWGLKTEKKRRTPANISFSLPRSGSSTWYWLEPSPESNNVAIPVSNSKETNTSTSAVDDSSVQPDEIPSLSNLVEAIARPNPHDADEESSDCSEESDVTYVSYQQYKNNHEQSSATSSESRMISHNDDDNWNMNYSKLLALKEKFGQAVRLYNNTNPPYHWEWILRKWLNVQQATLNPAIPSDKAKLEKLAAIGYSKHHEDLPTRRDVVWEKRYRELVEFHKLHRHCHVSKKDNTQLYSWINFQKKSFKRLQEKFSIARKNKLMKLGFRFEQGVVYSPNVGDESGDDVEPIESPVCSTIEERSVDERSNNGRKDNSETPMHAGAREKGDSKIESSEIRGTSRRLAEEDRTTPPHVAPQPIRSKKSKVSKMLRGLQPHNAYGDTEDTILITDERRRTRKRRITNEVSLTGIEDTRQNDDNNDSNKRRRCNDDDGQNQGDNNKRQRQGLRNIRKIVDLPPSYKLKDYRGRIIAKLGWWGWHHG